MTGIFYPTPNSRWFSPNHFSELFYVDNVVTHLLYSEKGGLIRWRYLFRSSLAVIELAVLPALLKIEGGLRWSELYLLPKPCKRLVSLSRPLKCERMGCRWRGEIANSHLRKGYSYLPVLSLKFEEAEMNRDEPIGNFHSLYCYVLISCSSLLLNLEGI